MKITKSHIFYSLLGVTTFPLGGVMGYEMMDISFKLKMIGISMLTNINLTNFYLIITLLLFFPFAISTAVWAILFYINRNFRYLENK